jgi:type I restriction enzyme R subunit
VIEKAALDAGFERAVGGTPEQRARVIRRLGRRKEVLEARHVIEAKAHDIFGHWARTAMPDGFGAQIVAVSRKAAVRYRAAILKRRTAQAGGAGPPRAGAAARRGAVPRPAPPT